MTQILNATNRRGAVRDHRPGWQLIEGPFDTNVAAWRALDRLDNQGSNAPEKRRSNKQVLWGQPQKGKSEKKLKRERKIAAQQADEARGAQGRRLSSQPRGGEVRS
jgi:hypothetical protein